MPTRLAGCAIALTLLLQPAVAQAPLKIGFVSTFSGPQGQLGEEIHAGFQVALDQLGGKLGGIPVEVLVGDDQTKPDVARQLVDKMIEQDKVDILTGMLNSSVLLAIARPALDAGKIVISSIAGPSVLAGRQCHPNFFVAAPQNDASSEAMGQYLQKKGVKRVVLISSNYPAGRDKMAGFKRFFKGEVAAELYPPFTQLDYAAEIAQVRANKPEAVFEFLPGGVGINFLKQLNESGLRKDVGLYTDFGGLDETMIAAVGDAALGAQAASFWSATMNNPVNARFVSGFERKFNRLPLLLDASIKAANGQVAEKAKLRDAMETIQFDAARGRFRFNTNHIPLSDFYLSTVAKDDKGRYVLVLGEKILSDHKDAYAEQCKYPTR
jgi:branched-chain amino acid transport system substrate-binding protein